MSLRLALDSALASNYQYNPLTCNKEELLELKKVLDGYQWSDQPPTEPTKPGEYWHARNRMNHEWHLAGPVKMDRGALMFCDWGVERMVEWQFAGPFVIAEPQEKAVCQSGHETEYVGKHKEPLGLPCEEFLTVRTNDEFCLRCQHRRADHEPKPAVETGPAGLELWGVWCRAIKDGHLQDIGWAKRGEIVAGYTTEEEARKRLSDWGSPPRYAVRRMVPPEPEPPQHPLLAAIDEYNEPELSHYNERFVKAMRTVRNLAQHVIYEASLATSGKDKAVAENAKLQAACGEMRALLGEQQKHHDECASGNIGVRRDAVNHAKQIRELLARTEQ